MLRRSLILPAVIAVIHLWGAASAAQGPDTLWTRAYGEGYYNDLGYSIEENSAGGYVIAGYTKSYGATGTDVFVVSTDAAGDTLWMRRYGGSSNDSGHALRRTSDGGYIVAGSTLSFGAGSYDLYVLRIDAAGDTLWTRTYGGADWDEAWSVDRTNDGGFVIVGSTGSFGSGGDAYVVRTDESGDTLWTKTFGGTGYDAFESIQETADGGFIIAGFTSSFGAVAYDVYLVRTDADGDSLWTRTYGGANIDKALSVCQTSDGGCIVAGYTQPEVTAAYLIRTDPGGDSLWTKTYGGDLARSVKQRPDGGFVFAGFTANSGSGGQDVYIVRTNPEGDTIWTRTYGGPYDDVGYSILCTADDGYAVAGGTDPSGFTKFDVWLLRMAPDCAGVTPSRPGGDVVVTFTGTPSPFKDRAIIEYSLAGITDVRVGVYDVLGREVRPLINRAHKAGEYAVIWDGKDALGRDVPSGLYLLRLDAGGASAASKILLVR